MNRTVHNTVFLVGFMGAGKTSVGRALAARLGWRFVDLDQVVEHQQGRTIADLFRKDGEPEFRRKETAALSELLQTLREAPGAAVALGGGAFVQPENARMLEQFGAPVVFLDAPVDELQRRCGPHSGVRPLFANRNQFRQLYEARREAYMAAGFRVDTADKSVPQVAAEVIQRLGLGEAHETTTN